MDHSQHVTQAAPEATQGLFQGLAQYFSQNDFMPHGHCYLWKPGLVYTHVISDFLIGTAYVCISFILYALVKKIKIDFDRIVLSFGVFIAACGLTHYMEIWNLWNADYWLSGWVKIITAFASVTTGVYLYRLRHPLVQVAEATKLAEQRRLDLEVLTGELEERVAERTRELTDAIKIRDQFLSMASHELKTPLTSLKLYTQMHAKKLKSDGSDMEHGKAVKFLNLVENQNERLSRLVDDMLDVSKIQSGKLELNLAPVNICNVVTDFVERIKPHFEDENNFLNFDLCEGVEANIDRFRMDQVLNNVIANALKYAPGKPVSIKVFIQDDKVCISISDEGKGIPASHLEKIFERYERATSSNDPSGMGLGLYISREIVLAHGGQMWAESEIGKGTTFYISLPVFK